MKTGLFELLKNVNQPDNVIKFLENSSFDELIEFDLDAKRFKSIYYVSKKYSMPLTKGSFEEMFISMSELLVHPHNRERFVELMSPDNLAYRLHSSELKGILSDEFRFKLIDGSWRWVELVLVSGEAFGFRENTFRIYVYDIQSRKARELGLSDELLSSDSNRNETTGLLRKKAFIKTAGEMLSKCSKNCCLISVDIENFKLFNEWYGHDQGDLLMVQIGSCLNQTVEEVGGAAGYFGMDDFCLLIPYDEDRIKQLYEDVKALISSNGSEIGFLPAFGVCLVEEGVNFLDLLDRAFLAAEVAKESFHSRIRLFNKKMYASTDEEYHILTDFLRAIKKNEVVFYLQPQCRASTGKIVGAEALARWIKPDGRIVPPNVFIPVLEKHELITDLDMYIWESVCKWLRRWIDAGNTPLPVSVNVSAKDILSIDLSAVFDDLLNKNGLSRNLLKIEFTESAYISNSSLVISTVRNLREKGFTVLMDDFGSGYSSLNMLKNLNVDIIKLDANFLNMEKDSETKSIQIIESITSMTKALGIPIIMEGVEAEEQKDFLQDLGCRYIQGYYFYRPMPVSEYEKLISDSMNTDTEGICFKANQQFRLREMLDNSVYSDSMLNSILGPCAFYSRHGDKVDIVRYNEQFYRAVDDREFLGRLNDIGQVMPESDVEHMNNMLDQAEKDRMNGSKGILHFYKSEGFLSTYFIRFYYLSTDGDEKLYYGSVQNITKLTALENYLTLLSRYSPYTVIFLRLKPEKDIEYSVMINGLEKDIGMNKEELQSRLNSVSFTNEIGALNGIDLCKNLIGRIRNAESFVSDVKVKSADGRTINLNAYGDYVSDETGAVDYIITFRRPQNDNL